MRTPFKTLTIGLALATAAMAGCSSTTAGSSGAVQNDAGTTAPSPTSSSAASTSPAPSPDPVTPTAEPTGAPASPVASPADSSSASDSPTGPALGGYAPNNDVCDAGLQYACGDIGQSGVGIVFYASSTSFDCGLDMDSSCNYLEVAPQKWNGTLVRCEGGCGGIPDKTSDWGSDGPGTGLGYKYCTGPGQTKDIPNASGQLIGTGYPNTSAMLTMCDSGNAAEQVRRYTGGGMTDWSLPSLDELNALYYYTGRNAIGGFAASRYWTSTQNPLNTRMVGWQDFNGGSQYSDSKNCSYGLRPVRAF